MAEFKDRHGALWQVNIDVGTVRDVIEQADWNILELMENDCRRLTQLFDDPLFLVQTLYAVCKDQIARREVTEEEFGRCFAGAALEEAAHAVVEAACNFFQPSKGAALRLMHQKITEGQEILIQKAIEVIGQIKMEGVGTVPAKSTEPVSSSPQYAESKSGTTHSEP